MLLENEGISKLLPLRLLLLCKAITTELITQKIERSVQRDRKPTFFTPMHISNSSIFKKKERFLGVLANVVYLFT